MLWKMSVAGRRATAKYLKSTTHKSGNFDMVENAPPIYATGLTATILLGMMKNSLDQV